MISSVSYNLYKIDDKISDISDDRYSEYYSYDKINLRWVKPNIKYSIKRFLCDKDVGACTELSEAEIVLILWDLWVLI